MPFQTFTHRRFRTSLDLNSFVVRHPETTFYVKVEGKSLEDSGIFSGDLLVIDRSIKPLQNNLVLAVMEGVFTVKHLSDLTISPGSEDYVWGTVIGIVRKL